MQENKRYKGLKTGKWISIQSLVLGLLFTVRSASTVAQPVNSKSDIWNDNLDRKDEADKNTRHLTRHAY